MKTIGVVGAGQMGAGIAQVAAAGGFQTLLSDRDLALAEAGKSGIEKRLASAAAKGKVSEQRATEILDRIVPVSGLADFADVDLVIEAASEREDIKRMIFDQLGAILPPHAIVATNTSSIPITRLAQSSASASQFIGVHFFNPVPVMRPIELIRGLATSDETVTAVEAFAHQIGKEVVHVNDAPGFVVNRVLLPMLNEAIFALGEGVSTVREIDAAVSMGLNHPMGPLTLADFIGLDTCLEILRVLQHGTGDQKYRPAPLLVKYVEAGWLGRKSGRGFYDYGSSTPVPTR